ncbi:MAG: DUF4293 domain-containing protein [Bacteroidota bacterium]
MIQRIQSVYLFSALVLVLLMFFYPIANILGKAHEFYAFGIKNVMNVDTGEIVLQNIPLVILFAVIAVLIFGSIFLYKKRVLQMRVVIYAMLLLVGSLGLTYYYLTQTMKQLDAPNYSFELAVTFPLVAIILLYLAFRGIRRDELLVRSINRIR